jgi:hypothetical protein
MDPTLNYQIFDPAKPSIMSAAVNWTMRSREGLMRARLRRNRPENS